MKKLRSPNFNIKNRKSFIIFDAFLCWKDREEDEVTALGASVDSRSELYEKWVCLMKIDGADLTKFWHTLSKCWFC